MCKLEEIPVIEQPELNGPLGDEFLDSFGAKSRNPRETVLGCHRVDLLLGNHPAVADEYDIFQPKLIA